MNPVYQLDEHRVNVRGCKRSDTMAPNARTS
jgi:hypothetical protein